jgi:hypothetical protein
MRKCATWWGIDSSFEDLSPLGRARDASASKDGDEDWEEPDEEKFSASKLPNCSTRRPRVPATTRPADLEMLHARRLRNGSHATPWRGVDDPFEWKEIKDRICRRYPTHGSPADMGQGWSIRIPGSISYSGRNRIVAVIEVVDDYGKIIWGQVPDEAKGMLNGSVLQSAIVKPNYCCATSYGTMSVSNNQILLCGDVEASGQVPLLGDMISFAVILIEPGLPVTSIAATCGPSATNMTPAPTRHRHDARGARECSLLAAGAHEGFEVWLNEQLDANSMIVGI